MSESTTREKRGRKEVSDDGIVLNRVTLLKMQGWGGGGLEDKRLVDSWKSVATQLDYIKGFGGPTVPER